MKKSVSIFTLAATAICMVAMAIITPGSLNLYLIRWNTPLPVRHVNSASVIKNIKFTIGPKGNKWADLDYNNTSNKRLSRIQIKLSLYDANKNEIDAAIVNTSFEPNRMGTMRMSKSLYGKPVYYACTISTYDY